MGFTPEQIKGRIKSVAKQNNADARTLMRIYMMERFLEVLWRAYQKKYSYAADIDYASVISGVRKLMDWIR